MAAASLDEEDEVQQWVPPISDWFRKLVHQAGLEDKYIDSCWRKLQELGISGLVELRAAVRTERCNGEEFNLADVDVPRHRRGDFKRVLLRKRLVFSRREVRVSLTLSRLAYDLTGPLAATTEDFVQEYKPQLLQRACCHDTQQKYIMAVVDNVFYVAFAGTHHPCDWSYNMRLLLESAPEAGGSVHEGFHRRAMSMKFHAIHRLAVHYNCTTVIFTGHSLGGAVATLSCLFVLQMQSERFRDVRACSFAAPLVASAKVSQRVEKNGWIDCFVNFVNSRDPVPRLLNLTQSVPRMLESSAEKLKQAAEAAPLFETLGRSLGTAIPGLSSVASSGVALAKAAEEVLTWMVSTAKQGSAAQALDAYHPFGVHVFITENHEFKVLESAQEVLDELGPAELLSGRAPSVTSLVAEDNVRRHDVVAYETSLKSREGQAFLLEEGGCAESGSGSPKTSVEVSLPDQLKVVVEDVTILKEEDRLIYGVQGENLDFISAACMQINPCNVSEGWGRVGMEPPSITMTHQNHLKIEQRRQSGTLVMPSASQAVMIRLCPDIGDCIEKPLRIVQGEEPPTSTEELSFDTNLLRKILKHAWLKRHFHKDRSLVVLLVQLGQTLHKIIDKDCFLHHVSREMDVEQALATVGEPEEIQEACAKVVQWLCPSGGLEVRTKSQLLSTCFLVATGFGVAAAAVVAGGGISYLFPMMRSTHGVFTAVGTNCGTYAAACRLVTQLEPEYTKLLTELLRGMRITYASHPWMLGWSVFKLEEELVRQFEQRSDAGQPIFDHGVLGDLTATSLESLSARIKIIGIINQMRRHVVRGLASICGPQNHGKTTLISQLLMLPEVSLKTGLDSQCRTKGVRPYQWGPCTTAFLLDSPGVDSRDSGLMNMFSKSGGLVGSAYVYIRLFNGSEQRDDAETIRSIMQASSSAKPHVLIVLNKISSFMRDAAQALRPAQELEEIREDMKEQIIQHCKSRHSGEEEVSYSASQLAHCLLQSWRQRFANVEIVFAELGMSQQSINDHPDLAEIKEMVYTAKDIGLWIKRVLDPKGVDEGLEKAVDAIDYDVWAKLTNEAREKMADFERPFLPV